MDISITPKVCAPPSFLEHFTWDLPFYQNFSGQHSITNYVVQQVSRAYSSWITEILHQLNISSLTPPSSTLGEQFSLFHAVVTEDSNKSKWQTDWGRRARFPVPPNWKYNCHTHFPPASSPYLNSTWLKIGKWELIGSREIPEKTSRSDLRSGKGE